jgi:hypothetical protein
VACTDSAAPEYDLLISHSIYEYCTEYTIENPEPSEELTEGECNSVYAAIAWLELHDDYQCRQIGREARDYFDDGRFSRWGFLASHYDPSTDTVQLHEERFEDFDDLIESVAHEILHSPEFGVSHDDSPNNFEIANSCRIEPEIH